MRFLTRKAFALAFSPNIMLLFRAQGRNQIDLVQKLPVTIPKVRQVLELVDRKNYVNSEIWDTESAYFDAPLSIGGGQTISAPHMHAHALEEMYPYLEKSQSDKLNILDVGCGSGYLTAALGRWVDTNKTKNQKSILGKPGNAYGIDIIPELVDMTRRNIQKGDKDLLNNGVVEIAVKNGWKGWLEKAPFDAIHVGAAVDTFPEPLMMQLKVGGVLLIPVGPDGGHQVFYKVERLAESPRYRDKDFRKQRLFDVRYVPLVH